MGWNPKLIFYVCVARGPTILAEYTSEGQYSGGVEELAWRCIERGPPNHLCYSHTVRKRSHTYLFDDPFVYFVISHEDLGVGEALRLLDRVKRGFRDRIVGVEGVGEVRELCFQEKMGPLFRDVLGFGGFDGEEEMGTQCLSGDEEEVVDRGRRKVGSLMLVKPSKVLVKKKRFFGGVVNGDHHVKSGSGAVTKGLSDVAENGSVVSVRELSVSMVHKGVGGVCGGGAYLGEGRQKAKKIWKKHVWVVLGLDLVVCAVLFAIWLCVCRGFKCFDG